MKNSSEQDFENILREGLKPRAVPPHLREAVLKALATDEIREQKVRARWSDRNYWRIAAGLLLAIAFGTLIGRFLFKPPIRPLAEDLIVDYLDMLSKSEPEQIVTSSSGEVENWFHGKLPFVFSIPQLKGAELLGARLCKLKTGMAGLIFYEVDGGKASLFVLNGEKMRLDGLEPLMLGSSQLRGTVSRGVNLVSWENNGVVYALVSALDQSTLLRSLDQSSL